MLVQLVTLAIIYTGGYFILRSCVKNLSFGRFCNWFILSLLFISLFSIVYSNYRYITRVARPPTMIEAILLNAVPVRPIVTTPEEALEKLAYVQNTEDVEYDCGVCFEEMAEGEELLACKQCKKAAHKCCWDSWFQSNNRICVYCRTFVD